MCGDLDSQKEKLVNQQNAGARWLDDIKKLTGRHWFQAAQNRILWELNGETYVYGLEQTNEECVHLNYRCISIPKKLRRKYL